MPDAPLGMKPEFLDRAEPDYRQFLERLSQEQLGDVVSKYAHEKNVTLDEAASHRDSFLRFMALTKLTNKSLSPDRSSDEFWHSFLAHTREYAAFCDRHFGTFVHHEPMPRDAPRDGPPKEYQDLLWEGFVVRADCNNTCQADWATSR